MQAAGLAVRRARAERVRSEIERLGALPAIVTKILRISDDPNAGIEDLAREVEQDPILAARLFKLANSSYYARATEVTTIEEAVRMLGFSTIRNLTLAASAGKIVNCDFKGYRFPEFGLWQHSVAVAFAAQPLAKLVGLPIEMEGELLLAGLLHDTGKLALDGAIAEAGVEDARVSLEIEEAAVGHTHTDVGVWIADKWKLPAHAAAVIAQHHEPDPDSEFAGHAAAIHLADYLVNRHGIGVAEDTEWDCPASPAALDILNLKEDEMDELESSFKEQLEAIGATCDALLG